MLPRRRPHIRKLIRAGDAKRLTAALDYEDRVLDNRDRVYDLGAAVRRDAALALSAVADTDEVDVSGALLRHLDDRSPEVREAAIAALSARREARAAPALAHAFLTWDEQRSPAIRRAAGEALLAMMAGPGTIEAVVRVVVGEPVRANAAREIVTGIVRRGGAVAARRAADAASVALGNSDDSGGLERAVGLLLWLQPHGYDAVVETLYRRGGLRPGMVIALGRLGDLRATPILTDLLSSHDSGIRAAAAAALRELADPNAREPLVMAARDPDRGVREEALRALQKLAPVTGTTDSVALPPEAPTDQGDAADDRSVGAASSSLSTAPGEPRGRRRALARSRFWS